MPLSGRSLSNSFTKTSVKTNLTHNRREYEEDKIPENIKKDKMIYNKHMIKKDARQEYKRIFGDALEEYNNKQKRNDRKIDDYYSHIVKSKDRDVYEEMVVGLGNREDWKDATLEEWETGCEVVERFVESFVENNPNMHVIGADLHGDEDSPHAHIVFIPEGEGYQRGLSKQVSFNKAMENQGHGKSRPFAKWRESNLEKMEEIAAEYGIERKYVGNLGFKTQEDYINDKEARERSKQEIDAYRDDQLNQVEQRKRQVEEALRKREEELQKEQEWLEEQRLMLEEEKKKNDESRESLKKDNHKLNGRLERFNMLVETYPMGPRYKKAFESFVNRGTTGLVISKTKERATITDVYKSMDKADVGDLLNNVKKTEKKYKEQREDDGPEL